MNTQKALVAGIVGGVVMAVYEFIMYGLIMASTYASNPEVFRQDAPMFWFPIVAVVVGLAGAMLFAKTRSAWSEGAKGGVFFGLWIGLVVAALQFYSPLVISGFPYYLAWCQAGIAVIGWMVYGAVVGAMYKG